MFSFIPFTGFIEVLEHFRRGLDFSESDPSDELNSEKEMKVIGNMKLESSPATELHDADFLPNKSFFHKKPPNSIESKHKVVQSHNNYTLGV